MLKKIVRLSLALVLSFSTILSSSMVINAEQKNKDTENSLNDDFVYNEDGHIIDYIGDGGVVVIPENVTIIREAAFKNKKITSVVFSSNLRAIEREAFANNSIDNIIFLSEKPWVREDWISGQQVEKTKITYLASKFWDDPTSIVENCSGNFEIIKNEYPGTDFYEVALKVNSYTIEDLYQFLPKFDSDGDEIVKSELYYNTVDFGKIGSYTAMFYIYDTYGQVGVCSINVKIVDGITDFVIEDIYISNTKPNVGETIDIKIKINSNNTIKSSFLEFRQPHNLDGTTGGYYSFDVFLEQKGDFLIGSYTPSKEYSGEYLLDNIRYTTQNEIQSVKTVVNGTCSYVCQSFGIESITINNGELPEDTDITGEFVQDIIISNRNAKPGDLVIIEFILNSDINIQDPYIELLHEDLFIKKVKLEKEDGKFIAKFKVDEYMHNGTWFLVDYIRYNTGREKTIIIDYDLASAINLNVSNSSNAIKTHIQLTNFLGIENTTINKPVNIAVEMSKDNIASHGIVTYCLDSNQNCIRFPLEATSNNIVEGAIQFTKPGNYRFKSLELYDKSENYFILVNILATSDFFGYDPAPGISFDVVATTEFNINVDANTAPTIVFDRITLQNGYGSVSDLLTNVKGYDNSGSELQVSILEHNVDFNKVGTYFVKYKVTDAEGYSTIEENVVTVVESGWQLKPNNKWEYIKNGAAVNGWQSIDGLQYYFENNEMVSDWWLDKNTGAWYFFNGGVMQRTNLVINGRVNAFDTYGVWKGIVYEDGWELQSNNKWKYYKNNKAVNGWQSIDGLQYYFENFEMVSDWWLDKNTGAWYFFNGGVMQRKNLIINGKVNIFDTHGVWKGIAEYSRLI